MAMSVGAGKLAGLAAVADARGVIAALAIDQRGAMRDLFARSMGVETASVPGENLVQFKEAVSTILTPHASAILLDPEYGLPAAAKRAPSAGLLLAYEQTGYDKNIPGRLPRLLDGWSVSRLLDAGANAVKLLLYYSSRSSAQTNETKYQFVQKVGAECAESAVPFFLELVSYADGIDPKGLDFARIKPDIVSAGITEFSDTKYRVDILKVGLPVNLAFVQGSPSSTGESLYTRQEAMNYCLQSASCARVPFIYLSEGVSNAAFQFGLELASEAGANFSGVLCGRATWKDGVDVFVKHGASALHDWLADEGVRNIENVNKRLANATPWYKFGNAAAGS
jgi:tagatose 1,6-diphosphate aldolase